MNKPCYRCHVVKDTSEMEEIGVWICKECLDSLDSKSKKKKK